MAGGAIEAAWRDAPAPLRVALVLALAWSALRPILLGQLIGEHVAGKELLLFTTALGGLMLLALYATGFWFVLARRQRVAHVLLIALGAFQVLGSLRSVGRYQPISGFEHALENPAFYVSTLGLVVHVALLALVAHPTSWAHTREAQAPPPGA